ncbi:unnamed protein product, partial [Gongylonema pulchrum]|uniref:GTP 3',8-cyclase n=1 Tax=Gongylonema pulchrum TaxID=637853 RepID=A0A183EPV4_9BILA
DTTQTVAAVPSQCSSLPESHKLVDAFGRQHKYLRISLVEKCNLRCRYCMPEEGVQLSASDKIMRLEEIVRLATVFAESGVKKIRLTGGEPTLRKDLVEIVEINGIEHVAMTTNGIAARRKLETLAKNGLRSVNISLDTLDPERYLEVTRRRGLNEVLRTIELAISIFGFVKINSVVIRDFNDDEVPAFVRLTQNKINNVVIRDFNDDEVPAFVRLTQNKNIEVRFIEYMPFMGNNFTTKKLISYKELLKRLDGEFPQILKIANEPNSTAKIYKVQGFRGTFGFISSMTEHFCGSCDRLRITADGNLKVCLHGSSEVSLRDILRSGGTNEDIRRTIIEAVKRKKERHAGSHLYSIESF